MLKIKDDVDLKELEKFGFIEEKQYNYYVFNNQKGTKHYVFKNRKMSMYLDNRADTHTSNDVLYDLIKADLVEKVD